jgi:RES domain-containing protein
MIAEAERRRVLERVPLVAMASPFHRFVEFGFVYDQLASGREPDVLAGLGARSAGGRFTPPHLFETLYVATTAGTAQIEAEFPLVGSGVVTALRPSKPYVHFGIDGQLHKVLDLTAPRVMQSLGLTIKEIHAPWRSLQAAGREAPTQTLGRLVYGAGHIEAILYPSSKDIPDGFCLAIFPDRLRSPSWLEISDETGRLRGRLP